ncbi:hypothetical protein My1_099 [Pectobacterium phage My1]|uniref:Uncharacterized protein n=1 Tax=Pectobacterium phage My1 TaxID=1204539 RepID=J9QM77_9CAUD|nr:hypothetical protein My1_099 [Pectobacterium phage My1]AFQ22258.1 hypothetical protein My1_099 [Pectobacterium phage My1]
MQLNLSQILQDAVAILILVLIYIFVIAPIALIGGILLAIFGEKVTLSEPDKNNISRRGRSTQ